MNTPRNAAGSAVEIRHFHLFAGLGRGARGFNRGTARVGQLQARFRCIGGVDVDPAALANFDPRTKVCSMNCGPHADDPRSHAERAFLCPECHTVEVPTMKPHEQRELVNDLTGIARKFHGSDQLRDRIANRLASRPPAPARDASAVELWRDLVGAVRFLEVDHALDGFPAVRMSMLSAMASEIERLAAEVDELHALRDLLGDLLSRTAVALRGPEPPLTRWSWHDVPDRAAAAIAAIDVMQRAAAKAGEERPNAGNQAAPEAKP